MSVIKKFCEVEEGLLIGRVSIDANSGNITTDGPVNFNALNVNDQFFVENNGAITANQSVLIGQNLFVEGLIEVVGNAIIGGTLNVASNSVFQNNLNINGTDLQTENALFKLLTTNVNTIQFGYSASDISIGKLSSDSIIRARSNFTVGRNLEVTGTLYSSNVNFFNAFTFDIPAPTPGGPGQPAAEFNSSLYVRDVSTFANDVIIDGSLRIKTNTQIDGQLNISNNLNLNDKYTIDSITGNTVIFGTVNVKGAVDLDSTLNVDGTVNIEGSTVIDDTLNVTGDVDIDSNLNVDGTVNIEGSTVIDDTLNVTSSLTINGTSLSTTVNNTLNISNKIATSKISTDDVALPNARLTNKTLTLGAWVIQEDPNGDGSILFSYNGTTVLSLASNGALTAKNDITSWGTPA